MTYFNFSDLVDESSIVSASEKVLSDFAGSLEVHFSLSGSDFFLQSEPGYKEFKNIPCLSVYSCGLDSSHDLGQEEKRLVGLDDTIGQVVTLEDFVNQTIAEDEKEKLKLAAEYFEMMAKKYREAAKD